MTQLDYNPASDTSRDAAIHTIPNRSRDQKRALLALVDAGETGLTDFELADAVSRDGGPATSQTSVGKRRLELERDGLVARRLVLDPEQMILIPDRRPAPSGAMAAVWCLAHFSQPKEL